MKQFELIGKIIERITKGNTDYTAFSASLRLVDSETEQPVLTEFYLGAEDVDDIRMVAMDSYGRLTGLVDDTAVEITISCGDGSVAPVTISVGTLLDTDVGSVISAIS